MAIVELTGGNVAGDDLHEPAKLKNPRYPVKLGRKIKASGKSQAA